MEVIKVLSFIILDRGSKLKGSLANILDLTIGQNQVTPLQCLNPTTIVQGTQLLKIN